jgi:hypothetical protein
MIMDDAAKLAQIQAILGNAEPAPAAAPANWEDLLAQAKNLPAQLKVDALKAMGFNPVGSDHTAECPYVLDSGYVCNCVPPATMWAQPKDVDELRGETWEQRRERAVNGPKRVIPAVERW